MALGATRPSGHPLRLRSPGGLALCAVPHQGLDADPRPVSWGTHVSVVDQVCVDVPAPQWDAELAFWTALLGVPMRASTVASEFEVSDARPCGGVHIILQRVGGAGPTRAHLDAATDDRRAEVARAVALGARVGAVHGYWTVLDAPGGHRHCITDRTP